MEIQMINGRQYLMYHKNDDTKEDNTAIRMMEQNEIEGLLPFKYIRQEKEKYFRYEIKTGEPLDKWMSRTQYRKNVIELLGSLIFANDEIEAYLLEKDHICTDPSFIFVQNNKCSFAYIPVIGEMYGNILEAALKIISSVKYALDEDFSYLFDLQNAFGRRDIQNIADLKKWLKIVNGEERPMNISDEEAAQEIFLNQEEKSRINISVDYCTDASGLEESNKKNTFEEVFGEMGLQSPKSEKHGLFFKSKKVKQEDNTPAGSIENQLGVQEKNIVKRDIINDLERGDSTVMVGGDNTPVLVRAKNGIEVLLMGDSYIIGSGAQNDIIVQDNPTVSRRHARIFLNDGFYYIEDIGSTNGTSVNGERLRKMEPCKLDDGARIRISNEDYIFVMRR